MGIANDLPFDNHLEIDDFLEVPIFKETLAIISTVREQGDSLEVIKDLFMWGLSYLYLGVYPFSLILEQTIVSSRIYETYIGGSLYPDSRTPCLLPISILRLLHLCDI